MKSLFLFGACIVLTVAHKSSDPYESEDPSDSEQYPYPAPPTYGEPAPAPWPVPKPYPGSQVPGQYPGIPNPEYPKAPEFKKLKTLHAKDVVKASVKYYKHGNKHIAIISCPENPVSGSYTWILADSRETIPSFGVPETVALAGGVNVEFVATYVQHHGKWEGRDFTDDDKQKFRRVGCYYGSTPSHIKTN
ncbi:unnamed protein product [Caenorhabditis brenneri]